MKIHTLILPYFCLKSKNKTFLLSPTNRNGFLGEKCLEWHFDVSEFETFQLFERDEYRLFDEMRI